MKMRIDRDRLDEGVASGRRGPRGGRHDFEIMVDLNQSWRMAGDIAPRARLRSAPADVGAARRATTCSGSRSRCRTPTCAGLPTLRDCDRDPDRRRRDAPHPARAARAAGGRRAGRLPDGRGARGRHAPRPHAGRARAAPAPRLHARTPGPTASACWPTCTSPRASAAGRTWSSRSTRRAGRRSAATSCWPSRSRIEPDGRARRAGTRPGWASSSTTTRSGGTLR